MLVLNLFDFLLSSLVEGLALDCFVFLLDHFLDSICSQSCGSGDFLLSLKFFLVLLGIFLELIHVFLDITKLCIGLSVGSSDRFLVARGWTSSGSLDVARRIVLGVSSEGIETTLDHVFDCWLEQLPSD